MSIQYLNLHMHTEHMLNIGNVTSAASADLSLSSDGFESAFSTDREQGHKNTSM